MMISFTIPCTWHRHRHSGVVAAERRRSEEQAAVGSTAAADMAVDIAAGEADSTNRPEEEVGTADSSA